MSLEANVNARIAPFDDDDALAPAKALIHAHAHKQPTITFFKLMRVSALITKKSAAVARPNFQQASGQLSIHEPLGAPLLEKSGAAAAIRPLGRGGNAAAHRAKSRERLLWR